MVADEVRVADAELRPHHRQQARHLRGRLDKPLPLGLGKAGGRDDFDVLVIGMDQIEDSHLEAQRRADRLHHLAKDDIKTLLGAQRRAQTDDLLDLPCSALDVAIGPTPLHPIGDHRTFPSARPPQPCHARHAPVRSPACPPARAPPAHPGGASIA